MKYDHDDEKSMDLEIRIANYYDIVGRNVDVLAILKNDDRWYKKSFGNINHRIWTWWKIIQTSYVVSTSFCLLRDRHNWAFLSVIDGVYHKYFQVSFLCNWKNPKNSRLMHISRQSKSIM